ncbi:MAG: MMPL family transporter [Thermoleophilaceae bacterium]|nr:MMPL family transporter [Thermoleophilaceae bacterium]
MLRGESFERLVGAVAGRARLVMAVVALLALIGAAFALRLEPSAGTETLVDSDSETFQETERFKREFGDDAVIVLVKGDLQRTILTRDLGQLLKLEGCLSGNGTPESLRTLPAPCKDLAKHKPARVVFGPGTFINVAAGRAQDELLRRRAAAEEKGKVAGARLRGQLARRGAPKSVQQAAVKAVRDRELQKFTKETLQLAVRYGISGVPAVDSPDFVSQLVFDRSTGEVGTPKARFGYLFPSKDAALVQVRLKPGLSDAHRDRAIALIKAAVGNKAFATQEGSEYVVTGVPVVVEALASELRRSIVVLFGAALLLMAATLALVFRTRLRMLPLALALASAAITFGALSVLGGSLTMASIAVLPVLIGLSVDYAIQFQARFDESRRGRREPSAVAAVRAAGAGGPTIATAGLATAVGFLVLLLSPVPMVRDFGVLLVLGVIVALGCALTAGFAALVHFSAPSAVRGTGPRALSRVGALGARLRGSRPFSYARDLAWRVRDSRPGAAALDLGWRVRTRVAELADRALALSVARPRRVLAVGFLVAVVGWGVDTQSEVVSDIRELVPPDLQALRDVDQLQQATGVSGELDVTVRADDVSKPEVLAWMAKFERDVLGPLDGQTRRSCSAKKGSPELCPALSLTDLFRSGVPKDPAAIKTLLAAVPPYFSQGVISKDRKIANLAFGIRLMPLERQREVIDRVRSKLNPPPGIEASVVGLPVLAADANDSLSSPWRRALTLLAALLAVFLVLFAVRRSARSAAVPLIPIALATGWSGALLFLLGLLPGPLSVALNPMSITLGALVIAISTEFSVLLSARYHQEREAGASPERAIELTYRSTGTAVLASGTTAIAGFAALIASDIRMLRDFGVLTVVDLTVSLLGVMLVLPAALVWAEQHGPFTLRDLDPRPLVRELWHARSALRVPRPRLPSWRRRRA